MVIIPSEQVGRRYWFGPKVLVPYCGYGGTLMRVKDDLRRCVVFLGHETADKRGIDCVGTGFQIAYDEFSYLVTAGHVAKGLEGAPFVIRVNERATGKGVNIPIDSAEWFFHRDYPQVDLAILAGSPGHEHDYVSLLDDFVLSPEEFAKQEIGPGDTSLG